MNNTLAKYIAHVVVILILYPYLGLPWWLIGKEFACQCRTQGFALSWEDSLKKEMATHCSILA